MNDVARVVDGYFAVWNETDATRRAELIARTWCEDGSYLDPLLAGDGHKGISDMVAAVHDQFPGHQFRLVGDIDGHHDRLRFDWELVDPATGTAVIGGVDFGEIAADGRLRAITGFLTQVPALVESA